MRTQYRNLPISKGAVVKDFAVFVVFKTEILLDNLLTQFQRQFAILLTEIFPQWRLECGGINQLDFTLAVLCLAVGQYLDKCAYTRIVKHIVG